MFPYGLDAALVSSHWVSPGEGRRPGGARTVHFLILPRIRGRGLERVKVKHALFLRRIDCRHHTALYEAFSRTAQCRASPAGLGRQHWREERNCAAAPANRHAAGSTFPWDQGSWLHKAACRSPGRGLPPDHMGKSAVPAPCAGSSILPMEDRWSTDPGTCLCGLSKTSCPNPWGPGNQQSPDVPGSLTVSRNG